MSELSAGILIGAAATLAAVAGFWIRGRLRVTAPAPAPAGNDFHEAMARWDRMQSETAQ